MDDRIIADIVNTVRDIARSYYGADQLRARLAHVIVPHLTRIRELKEERNAARREAAEAQATAERLHSAAHRLALESECFYLDCKDMPVLSKWSAPMLDAIGVVQSIRWDGDTTALTAAIEAARKEERESCAKICDALTKDRPRGDTYAEGWNDALDVAEQAIQARGAK